MAEEAPKTTPTITQEEAVLHVEEVVVTDVAASDKKEDTTTTTTTATNDPEPEKNTTAETDEVSKTSTTGGVDEKVPESGSFKEESTRVSDLAESEKKALQELKSLIQNALNNHEFSAPASSSSPPKEEEKAEPVVAAGEEKNEEEEKPVEEEKKQSSEPGKEAEQGERPTKQDEEAEKKKEEEEEVKETEVVAEEKVVATEASPVDDDGAKTVEAIEETVVAVTTSSTVPSPPEAEAEAAPKEEPKEPKEEEEKEKRQEPEQQPQPPEEVSIWGVPLLQDDRTDVILLKFLRARDFKVKEAFTMIKNTIRWRKEFKIEELIDEDLGDDLNSAVYMHGYDKEGHPVCYNIYGEFQNKDLYKKTFSDEEKRLRFLRWRIQFLERSIRKLDFSPGGISTIVQVNDLKNSPGPAKRELRQATNQALQLLQDNYPEFVAKQVFINVPWWYLAVNRMISPFLTQRTKSKFVFAGPSKSAETLLRYIAPEQLPVKYGGLSKDGEFGNTDAVTEITVRPAAKHTVEFPVTESCLLSWELRVIGWDVSYSAEFVPSSEGSYTVIIQKARKVASSEEPVLCNSYKIGEPGKVVINIDNSSSKKKKLLYRLKTKPSNTTD